MHLSDARLRQNSSVHSTSCVTSRSPSVRPASHEWTPGLWMNPSCLWMDFRYNSCVCVCVAPSQRPGSFEGVGGGGNSIDFMRMLHPGCTSNGCGGWIDGERRESACVNHRDWNPPLLMHPRAMNGGGVGRVAYLLWDIRWRGRGFLIESLYLGWGGCCGLILYQIPCWRERNFSCKCISLCQVNVQLAMANKKRLKRKCFAHISIHQNSITFRSNRLLSTSCICDDSAALFSVY